MRTLGPLTDIRSQPLVVWPTEVQQLLLHAALLDGPAAQAAWDQWQKLAPIEAMDIGSWRLIPLVYVNLKRVGISDPLLTQAKACHFNQWKINQKIFQQSAEVLDELERLEIPALVVKGVALAHLYYPDTGSRPMADFDVLVPEDRFCRLAAHLIASGWTCPEYEGSVKESFPSVLFMRPDGFGMDLHPHLLHQNCAAGADAGFWSHAQSWTLKQKPARTLSSEDHLLHAITHGVGLCQVPPFRWIADAWWILERTRGNFDWDRVVEQARFHKVDLEVYHGLEFMNQLMPLKLPPHLLSRLRAIPNSVETRIQFVHSTHVVPKRLLPRIVCIGKALAQNRPDYSVIGNTGCDSSGPQQCSNVFQSLFHFCYAAACYGTRTLTRILARFRELRKGMFSDQQDAC